MASANAADMEGEEEEEKLEVFPDISQKLSAPKKLSAYEKERAYAAAKEKRAEAENAAALRAFQDSFANDDDDDDDPLSHLTNSRGPPSGPRGPGMAPGGPGGRYGMPPGGPRSGPGSLGPIPGPPPPSLKRKRALDEMREAQEARRGTDEFYYDDSRSPRGTPQEATREEELEMDAPRQTIQLTFLPPNMSTDDVKSLLKDHLNVYSVRFQPPAVPGPNVKRSTSAIATLASDITTSQIDATISTLKGKYLGFGFYLNISRHLSSTTLHPSMATSTTTDTSEPFGAERQRDQRGSLRNAPPPPMDQRGFAPPDSYDSAGRGGYGRSDTQSNATVPVRTPFDIKTIRAVHTIVDTLLLEPDPQRALQTEALLMAQPKVQRDERFAFLYDSRSPAGIYYRYLLWSPDDQEEAVHEMKRRARGPERIYKDVAIDWLPPYSQVPFPDLRSLAEAVTHVDYISSDEESDDEEGERKFNSGREGDGAGDMNEKKHLAPLQRARLIYLLSRLPTTNARLRKGDVARLTNFAIGHAGQGAEEIVDLLLLNVGRPFSYSLAAKYEDEDEEQDEEDEYSPDEELSNIDNSPAPEAMKNNQRDDDPSNAKLVALYVISDILSASATAGARNAWKYRQLFESGLRAQKTFEHLGKLDRTLGWGRLKSEQWKRKVAVLFGIWEGWSLFSNDVHEELKKGFFDPPLSEEEKAAARRGEEREEAKKAEEKWAGKFKRMDHLGQASGSVSPAPGPVNAVAAKTDADVDGAPIDGIDGAPLDDVDGAPLDGGLDEQPVDMNLDGAPLDDIDGAPLDGVPLGGVDGTVDGKIAEPQAEDKPGFALPSTTHATEKQPAGPRRRMRAEDMFADSDED